MLYDICKMQEKSGYSKQYKFKVIADWQFTLTPLYVAKTQCHQTIYCFIWARMFIKTTFNSIWNVNRIQNYNQSMLRIQWWCQIWPWPKGHGQIEQLKMYWPPIIEILFEESNCDLTFNLSPKVKVRSNIVAKHPGSWSFKLMSVSST